MSIDVLREVRLYGDLGRRFGRVHFLAVATPSEAARALCVVLDGFERMFLGPDGKQAYHVFVGRSDARRDIAEGEIGEPLGANDPIRFVPVIEGAKRAGTLQVIVGAVLVVAGVVINVWSDGALSWLGTPMIQLGASLIVGGVVAMISAQRPKSRDSRDNASYVFDGPQNNTDQGGPVPVVYGRVITGSTVVSQGLSTEQLVVSGGSSPGSNSLPPYEPRYPRQQP